MNRKKTSLFAFSIAAIVLAALTPGAALAAPEHQVILEIEFEGESCESTLVTVSAQSCDGDELAAELTAELDDELGAAGCGFAAQGDWQCFWTAQAGCTQVRERATLEPGADCKDGGLQGQIFRPLGIYGFFNFDTF